MFGNNKPWREDQYIHKHYWYIPEYDFKGWVYYIIKFLNEILAVIESIYRVLTIDIPTLIKLFFWPLIYLVSLPYKWYKKNYGISPKTKQEYFDFYYNSFFYKYIYKPINSIYNNLKFKLFDFWDVFYNKWIYSDFIYPYIYTPYINFKLKIITFLSETFWQFLVNFDNQSLIWNEYILNFWDKCLLLDKKLKSTIYDTFIKYINFILDKIYYDVDYWSIIYSLWYYLIYIFYLLWPFVINPIYKFLIYLQISITHTILLPEDGYQLLCYIFGLLWLIDIYILSYTFISFIYRNLLEYWTHLYDILKFYIDKFIDNFISTDLGNFFYQINNIIYNSIIVLIDSLIKIHPNFSILNEIKLYHILIFFCSIRLIMEILDKKNNRKKIILFLFTAIFDLTITIGYYLYDRKKKGKWKNVLNDKLNKYKLKDSWVTKTLKNIEWDSKIEKINKKIIPFNLNLIFYKLYFIENNNLSKYEKKKILDKISLLEEELNNIKVQIDNKKSYSIIKNYMLEFRNFKQKTHKKENCFFSIPEHILSRVERDTILLEGVNWNHIIKDWELADPSKIYTKPYIAIFLFSLMQPTLPNKLAHNYFGAYNYNYFKWNCLKIQDSKLIIEIENYSFIPMESNYYKSSVYKKSTDPLKTISHSAVYNWVEKRKKDVKYLKKIGEIKDYAKALEELRSDEKDEADWLDVMYLKNKIKEQAKEEKIYTQTLATIEVNDLRAFDAKNQMNYWFEHTPMFERYVTDPNYKVIDSYAT